MVSFRGAGIGVAIAFAAFILLARIAPPDTRERLSGVGAGVTEFIAAPFVGVGRGLGELGTGLEAVTGSVGDIFGSVREFFEFFFNLGETAGTAVGRTIRVVIEEEEGVSDREGFRSSPSREGRTTTLRGDSFRDGTRETVIRMPVLGRSEQDLGFR